MLKIVIVLVLGLAVSGCATSRGMSPSPQSSPKVKIVKQAAVVPAPREPAVRAAPRAQPAAVKPAKKKEKEKKRWFFW